jgi:hypothetical protein
MNARSWTRLPSLTRGNRPCPMPRRIAWRRPALRETLEVQPNIGDRRWGTLRALHRRPSAGKRREHVNPSVLPHVEGVELLAAHSRSDRRAVRSHTLSRDLGNVVRRPGPPVRDVVRKPPHGKRAVMVDGQNVELIGVLPRRRQVRAGIDRARKNRRVVAWRRRRRVSPVVPRVVQDSNAICRRHEDIELAVANARGQRSARRCKAG